jgi:hypothetical protein
MSDFASRIGLVRDRKGEGTPVIHSPDPTPISDSLSILLPLGSLDSNNIAKGSMHKTFKYFSNCDLAIVALFLEEEN